MLDSDLLPYAADNTPKVLRVMTDNDFRDNRIGDAEVTVKVSDGLRTANSAAQWLQHGWGKLHGIDLQGVKAGSAARPHPATDAVEAGPEDVRLIIELDE